MRITLQAYLKETHEAIAHYQKAFDATLGYHEFNPDNTYMHAEINLNDQHVISISESSDSLLLGNNMQFCVNFGDEQEDKLKKAYNVLTEGGQILYPIGPCAWNRCMADVIDKFGVRWYLAL